MSIFELTDPLFLPHHGCDVKLLVPPGEVAVLWGENGLGKTTLLQRFFQQMSSDGVMVDQKALEFFYDRSVGVVLDYFTSLSQVGGDPQRLSNLLATFDLHSKRDRLLSQLSGGEMQMLKLSLSLCLNRPIYLLDEPLQFLDAYRRLQVVDHLEQLRSSGAALLVVEHNLEGIPHSWKRYHLCLVDNWLKALP